MKSNILIIIIILVSFFTCGCYSGPLSKKDVALIHKDINHMYEAFENGDFSLILNNTHDSILKLVGSKQIFEKMLDRAIEQAKSNGLKYINNKLYQPDNLYIVGKEEICFIPRVSTLKIDGKTVTRKGFMIAIRKKGESKWKYLDGAGFKQNPNSLWLIFPKLPRDVKLPENYDKIHYDER